jgi:sterol desaturase/sphingolipid hydroxylase (fatty acid hydroxylase superfamily)
MDDFILSNQPAIRLTCFFAVLVGMAVWEVVAPRRERQLTRLERWPHNIGIVVVNTLIVRVLFPTAAVGMAIYVESRGWGLLNGSSISHWILVPLCVAILDLAIYLQHVMFHAVPLLWRFHRMHHADLDFDVTTGARFHPVEIVLSMLIKFAVIIALAPPALAVFAFEVILNATSMFNHRPCASFDRRGRDQQQLRIQSAVVGPAFRNLSRSAPRRARANDDRYPRISKTRGV